MEKIKKKHKKRYENNDLESDNEKDSCSSDESLMIRIDSPSNSKNNRNSFTFTEEFIKNLPSRLVKKILEIRSECFINYSRETKLLSQNHSYQAKMREQKEEIERLKMQIEDLSSCYEKITQIAVKKSEKSLNKKISKLEDRLKSKSLEIERILSSKAELENSLITLSSEQNESKSLITRLEKQLESYQDLCEFAQIPMVRLKLSELPDLNSRLQELVSKTISLTDRNSALEHELATVKLDLSSKSNEIILLNLQVKSLEDAFCQSSIRSQTLEQLLKEKQKSHQDLLNSFKLLQDELNSLTRRPKQPNPNQSQIDMLKSALSSKLQSKSYIP